VAGRTSGAFPGATNQGQFDLFVALLSGESGEVLALGQFGDQYSQHPMSLTVLPSGDLVVAGLDDTFVEGNAVLGQPTQFVARFAQDPDRPGAFVQKWWRQPNEPAPQSPQSIAFSVASVDAESGDVVVASHLSTATARGGGAHLTRLDDQGAVVWDKLISPLSLDWATSVSTSPSGRLYVAGATAIPLAGPALDGSDGFLMERDPKSGNLIWGQQFGTNDADWVSSLAIDPSGALFVGGFTLGIEVPGRTPRPNSTFAQTFSENGVPLGVWRSELASSSFMDSLSIVPSCNGAALLAGNASGEFPTLPSLGKMDALILPIQTVSVVDAIFSDKFE
jgi:hypothetical protein